MGESLQSFLSLVAGTQARAAWLTRSFQARTDAPSVPRVINQLAFYTAISKGVQTGVCKPDHLRLHGRVLRGLLVALSLIK